MKHQWILFFALLVYSQLGFAIVTRHDVPTVKYEVSETPDYLIDMPHDGHGALIAPNWIVTVAHVIFYDYTGKNIIINNTAYKVEKVIKHREFRSPGKSLTQGDATPLMDFIKGTSDIALVKLSSPVEGILPIALYAGDDEAGQVVTAFGRGSTGDGFTGAQYATKKQKVLRTMTNRIEKVDGQWLSTTFDKGPNATELEGIDGSGDSGGPLVIYKEGTPYLAGLFSWDFVEGDLALFTPGLYGHRSYQVRISHYRSWIHHHMNMNK